MFMSVFLALEKSLFTSISAAKASAIWREEHIFQRSLRRYTQYLTPYNCDFCKHYHLGHAQFTKQVIQNGEKYG